MKISKEMRLNAAIACYYTVMGLVFTTGLVFFAQGDCGAHFSGNSIGTNHTTNNSYSQFSWFPGQCVVGMLAIFSSVLGAAAPVGCFTCRLIYHLNENALRSDSQAESRPALS